MERIEWSAAGKSRLERKKHSRRRPAEEGLADRTGPKRQKRRKSSTGLVVMLLIGVLVGSIYLGFSYADKFLAGDEETAAGVDKENKTITEREKGGPEKRDVLSVLVIGADQRGKEAARADTLILALFDKKDQQMYIFSIPRDTRAKIPGRGTEKINHAYAYGGGELIKQAVEELLDIQVDGYIATNFAGFARIVDIIGGLEYDVEQRMYTPLEGIDLYPGKQMLDGEKALAYVRFRDDGRADIGRMERQQKFLKALAKKLMSVSSVPAIPSLVKEFNNNVKTDLSVVEMIAIANQLRSVDLDNLVTKTLPGEAKWYDQTNYWVMDQGEAKKMLNEILYVQESKEPVESPIAGNF